MASIYEKFLGYCHFGNLDKIKKCVDTFDDFLEPIIIYDKDVKIVTSGLYEACVGLRKDVIIYLLSKGCSKNNQEYGKKISYLATEPIKRGRMDIVEILVKHGINFGKGFSKFVNHDDRKYLQNIALEKNWDYSDEISEFSSPNIDTSK